MVHDGVALVKGVSSCGHPVGHDDGVVERPEGDVDAADTHAPDVDCPSENPEVAKVKSSSFDFELYQCQLVERVTNLPF